MDKQISKCTTAVFVWAICFVAILMCVVMLWALSQADSLPDIALLAYPVVGLVALIFSDGLVKTPMTFASIGPDGAVTFTWRYLFSCKRKVFHASSLAEPTLEERIDDDGDSDWSVQLVLPDDSVFTIAEYAVRTGSGKNEKTKQRCETKRTQFMEGLSRVDSSTR